MIASFIQLMVALKDGLDIKTLIGTIKKLKDTVENPPKYNVEKHRETTSLINNKQQGDLFIMP